MIENLTSHYEIDISEQSIEIQKQEERESDVIKEVSEILNEFNYKSVAVSAAGGNETFLDSHRELLRKNTKMLLQASIKLTKNSRRHQSDPQAHQPKNLCCKGYFSTQDSLQIVQRFQNLIKSIEISPTQTTSDAINFNKVKRNYLSRYHLGTSATLCCLKVLQKNV